MRAHVSAIASQKGGTAKTALAASIAPLLALSRAASGVGGRTLLIDLDQQANLTALFGHTADTLEASVVDVLAPVDPVSVRDAIVRDVAGVPGLDLLASDLRAAGLEKQLAGELMREQKLRNALEDVQGEYAEVVIDCPPNLGDMTVNALCAADDVLAPINMEDKNAMQGAVNLARTIAQLRSQRQQVSLKALIRTKVNPHAQTYRALNAALLKSGLPVARTEMPARADWHNSLTEDTPLILWRGQSDAKRSLRDLVAELWPDLAVPYASEVRAVLNELRQAEAPVGEARSVAA